MNSPGPPFRTLSTFFASRERCRLPEGLLLVEIMRRAGGLAGSFSLRAGARFVISPARSAGGIPRGEEVVEVADYDPVRHTALVIGLTEPSPDAPIHWLVYRTDEYARAAAFIWEPRQEGGGRWTGERHPAGSFQEAMSVVGLARKAGGVAGVEGRGYLVTARGAEELLARIGSRAGRGGAGGRPEEPPEEA